MKTVAQLYRDLEDGNEHNLAAILAAVAAEDLPAVIRLAAIADQHELEGMTAEMSAERRRISKPLFDRALRKDYMALSRQLHPPGPPELEHPRPLLRPGDKW